jgi:curli biogenesis system outer membrane secretion channel CsgG
MSGLTQVSGFFGRSLALLAFAVALAAALPATADTPGPYAGLRKTVAVDTFQTPDSIIGGAGTSEGLTSMLTDALVHDGRFVVVERDALSVISTEQQLGTQHSTTAETSAAAGNLIGANLIVRGAVTKFEAQAQSNSISIAGVGMSSGHAVVAVTLRVIDTTTGQVIATSKGEGTAATHGATLSLVVKGQPAALGSQNQTPLGQAAEEAISRAVAGIVTGMEHAPWSALVVDNADGHIYINAGAAQNLQPQTVLHVYRKDRDLTDPATGIVLETLRTDVGVVRVTEVREKVSVAEVVSGGPPVRGDMLQLQ